MKPEILEDEKTASLTDAEFRVFISLILLADDHGNLRANVGFLHGVIYWAHDSLSSQITESALKKLNDYGLISFYVPETPETTPQTGVKQVYAHIVNWSKHQKIDRPGTPKVPGFSNDYEVIEFPGRIRHILAMDQDQDQDQDQDLICGGTGSETQKPGISEVREVFETYLNCWKSFHGLKGGRPPALSPKRIANVRARLKESDVETAKNAVKGLFLSDHHTGKKDGTTWLLPEYVFRSTVNFEMCLGHYERSQNKRTISPRYGRMPNPSRDPDFGKGAA